MVVGRLCLRICTAEPGVWLAVAKRGTNQIILFTWTENVLTRGTHPTYCDRSRAKGNGCRGRADEWQDAQDKESEIFGKYPESTVAGSECSQSSYLYDTCCGQICSTDAHGSADCNAVGHARHDGSPLAATTTGGQREGGEERSGTTVEGREEAA